MRDECHAVPRLVKPVKLSGALFRKTRGHLECVHRPARFWNGISVAGQAQVLGDQQELAGGLTPLQLALGLGRVRQGIGLVDVQLELS